MAKLTYLQLINRVLKRITQPEISTVVGITGQAKIISEMINEAQTELWTESTNWYSLFKQRTFYTVTYSASTIAFVSGSPATITDSANGLVTAGFQNGMTISVQDPSSHNTGAYIVETVTAGTLTLQASDTLVDVSEGATVIIYACTYPVASDFGRAYHIVDVTNDRILTEDVLRAFSEDDPQMDNFSEPTHFAMQGDFYRLYYIPDGRYEMVDRYWMLPTPLASDTDTSDLPLFCENFLIQWAYMNVLEYMNKFDVSDRIRLQIYGNPKLPDKGILQKAKIANTKVLDKMFKMSTGSTSRAIMPPRFPSSYGARYY